MGNLKAIKKKFSACSWLGQFLWGREHWSFWSKIAIFCQVQPNFLETSPNLTKLGIPTKSDLKITILRSKNVYDVIICTLWRHKKQEISKKACKRPVPPTFLSGSRFWPRICPIESSWRHSSPLMTSLLSEIMKYSRKEPLLSSFGSGTRFRPQIFSIKETWHHHVIL